MTGKDKEYLEEIRWQRLSDKDTAEDDVFYYGVVTTGVYCRPGCSARKPRRHNVEFFDTREEAERLGYRPCKKCSPEKATKGERNQRKIVEACRIIEKTRSPITLKELAVLVDMSPYHFHRCFKKVIGVTPHQYFLKQRADRFKRSLEEKEKVAEAAFSAGFESLSGAYNQRIDQLGMMPGAYREGGKETTILFGTAGCALGFVLVALTSRGICAVELGDDPLEMENQFKKRFPQGEIKKGGENFKCLIAAVVHCVDNPEIVSDLPLDIQGTAFQQKVWNFLRTIEPGQTSSYSEIAEKIGRPKAARAVGKACATNKIAVLVPCHRVLTKDKKMSGYRWGIQRKQKLLDLEKKESE